MWYDIKCNSPSNVKDGIPADFDGEANESENVDKEFEGINGGL